MNYNNIGSKWRRALEERTETAGTGSDNQRAVIPFVNRKDFKMVNSAGVNFGKPNEEFIIESDGNGALTSARNAVTGDEYVGGTTEVITGTVAIPFPDMTQEEYNQFISDMVNGHAAGKVIIDASVSGLGNLPSGLFASIDDNGEFGINYMLIAQVADPTNNNQLQILWENPDAVQIAKARVMGTLVDMLENAENFPITTTIYRF